jgi:hypothetical protein
MNADPPICPACDRPMETGFLVDHGHGVVLPAAWVPGVPEWSRWRGLRLKGRTKMPVTTFRCPECGRLESFARPGSWPG